MARVAACVLVLALLAAASAPDASPAPRSEYPVLVAGIASTAVAISQAFGGLEASLSIPLLLVPPDKMSCRGRIGSRGVKGTAVFRPGRVTCRWKLPPGSRGKILYGTISITVHGRTIVKHFRQRIR